MIPSAAQIKHQIDELLKQHAVPKSDSPSSYHAGHIVIGNANTIISGVCIEEFPMKKTEQE